MVVMHEMEVIWEDLLEGFQNQDPEIVYFLDRETGEVFSVPADYEDESFWEEMENHSEQFLEIPGFDFDQERLLLHEFTKMVTNSNLKTMLESALLGKLPYGRLDEILSFYPDEQERLAAMKEDVIAERIRSWLEEHDIYAHGEELSELS